MMHDFSRLFVTTGEKVWGSSEGREPKSKFVLRTSYNGEYKFELIVMWGCDPTVKQLFTAIGLFVNEYKKEFGEGIPIGGRKYRHRFCHISGSSGCYDTYVEEEIIKGFPDRVRLFHVSCFDKVSGFKCNAQDIFELLAAINYLDATGASYSYDPALDKDKEGNERSKEFKVIRPRITEEESGWSFQPTNIVPYNICRNIPDSNDAD